MMSLPSSPVCGCGGLAPAPVEQDGGGCHARGVLVAVAHDGGKGAHGLVCIGPAQRPDVRWYSLCWQRLYGVGTPSCWRWHRARVRRGDNHANNITQKARTLLTEDADAAFLEIGSRSPSDRAA